MLTIVTLWWLSFFTAVGLCVGSFLNVVVFRIPADRSLRDPLWSFCPHCRRPIRWFDNIPVVSFLWLRGRCRDCGVPIATRYPVIELITAITVLMVFDAFFVGNVRTGLFPNDQLGVTESLAYDWPIFAAHVILFACLLAMSVIDLEHYWVDIRFTNLAVVAGFVCHTLWTPKHSSEWIRPSDTTAFVGVCAVAGLAVVWIALACQPHEDPEDFGEPVSDDGHKDAPSPSTSRLPPSLQPPSRAFVWVAGGVLLGLLLLLAIHGSGTATLRHAGRALVPLLLLCLLILVESVVPRASDQAIVDAIHEERHDARRMVLRELAFLAPAILFGLIGFWIMGNEAASARIAEALHGEIRVPGISLLRHWSPLSGFATAATGYVIAGAIGWGVRIGFTLLFGKEAFGAGDVHMMAAAGCVAGWPVVLIGFMLTCALALFGWLVALPFKRTRAVPLGPWLSLGFLATVVFYDPIVRWPVVARAAEAAQWLFTGATPGQ